jgi:hypothetical protein
MLFCAVVAKAMYVATQPGPQSLESGGPGGCLALLGGNFV